MTKAEIQAEALTRAKSGQSVANFAAIFQGFMERGIPEAEIQPRVNVLTYNAWKAVGRQVRKGERGVRVITWIERAGKDGESDRVRFARHVSVFHISQTDEPDGGRCPDCNRDRGHSEACPAAL